MCTRRTYQCVGDTLWEVLFLFPCQPKTHESTKVRKRPHSRENGTIWRRARIPAAHKTSQAMMQSGTRLSNISSVCYLNYHRLQMPLKTMSEKWHFLNTFSWINCKENPNPQFLTLKSQKTSLLAHSDDVK